MQKKVILILLIVHCLFNIQAQNVIFNEGFENVTTTTDTSSTSSIAGATGWSYSKTNYGRLRFAAGSGFYNSGSRAATLDDHNISSNTIDSWNQLIKTIDLTTYVTSNDLVLDFYFMDHGDETDAAYDVISIRASDTSTWFTVYSLLPASKTNGSWNHVFLIWTPPLWQIPLHLHQHSRLVLLNMMNGMQHLLQEVMELPLTI